MDSIYHSSYILNLDKLFQQNICLVIVVADFNAKSNNWFRNHNSTNEAKEINIISSNWASSNNWLTDFIYHITHLLVSIHFLILNQT